MWPSILVLDRTHLGHTAHMSRTPQASTCVKLWHLTTHGETDHALGNFRYDEDKQETGECKKYGAVSSERKTGETGSSVCTCGRARA